MTRRYGRARRGARAVYTVPPNRSLKLSVISSVRLQGVVASLSVKGAIDTPLFDTYLK